LLLQGLKKTGRGSRKLRLHAACGRRGIHGRGGIQHHHQLRRAGLLVDNSLRLQRPQAPLEGVHERLQRLLDVLRLPAVAHAATLVEAHGQLQHFLAARRQDAGERSAEGALRGRRKRGDIYFHPPNRQHSFIAPRSSPGGLRTMRVNRGLRSPLRGRGIAEMCRVQIWNRANEIAGACTCVRVVQGCIHT